MAPVEQPLTAHTPTDLFTNLALASPLSPHNQATVPAISFSPPTPPPEPGPPSFDDLDRATAAHVYIQQLKQRLYGPLLPQQSSRPVSSDLVREIGILTPEPSDSDEVPPSENQPRPLAPSPSLQEASKTTHSPSLSIAKVATHRPLASNEARQLSLLLIQHFFPIRSNPRGLMKESISLAEKLHEAGIRWDTKRRVMGMHLRGIWEEGQRLSQVVGDVIGGHGPMDLYVQGSFLSITEKPHPLDPMPIPLELHPASFTALPKLTLQAGLANSLPGAPSDYEHVYPAPSQSHPQQPSNYADRVIARDYAHLPDHGASCDPHVENELVGDRVRVGDHHSGLFMGVEVGWKQQRQRQVEMGLSRRDNEQGHGVRSRWKARKTRHLRIHTDGHSRLTTRTRAFNPYHPMSADHKTHPQIRSQSQRLTRLWARKATRGTGEGNLSAKFAKRKLSDRIRLLRLLTGRHHPPRSAKSARLTFGTWEMR